MAALTAARNLGEFVSPILQDATKQSAVWNILRTEERTVRTQGEHIADRDTHEVRYFRLRQVGRQWLRPLRETLISRSGFALGLVLGLSGVVACGGDVAGPTFSTAAATVYTFKLDWPAINLALTAPYDTIQLTATVRDATGAVVTDTSTVQFTTQDTAVTVSPTGLVTAHFLTSNQALVIASRTVHGVTLVDTAVIQVTQTPLPAPLATVSIQPQPGGIARAQCFVDDATRCKLPFFATIATGDPATDTLCTARNGLTRCNRPLLVHYASSDPTKAVFNNSGRIFLQGRPGRLVFTISTVAYGVHKVDSLPFSIGYLGRALADVEIDSTQHPPIVILFHNNYAQYGAGAILAFSNYTDEDFLITIPVSDHDLHGVHFPAGSTPSNNPGPAAIIDTIPPDVIDDLRSFVNIQFDSAGTYTLQLRGLQTGITFTDTVHIYPFP